MIFHRIASAIRRQDWFTVLIEIVIVVIGLLIGLQINNWNESRADRAKEVAFLERLARDVDLSRQQLAEFIVRRETRNAVIARVEDMYFGEAEIVQLDEEECLDFVNMHIITHPPMAVPSIAEAFEGGRIDLITDEYVIQELIAVKQSEERLRTLIDSFNLDRPDLTQKYPQAISLVRAKNQNEEESDVFARGIYRAGAQCHFLDQERNQEFLNDVLRGFAINGTYVFFMERHLERLDELASVLERTPGSGVIDPETR